MSFADKFKQRLNAVEKHAITSVGLEVADEEKIKSRMDTCNSCEHLFRLTRNCKKCGCFVDLKTKINKEKCPINKW